MSLEASWVQWASAPKTHSASFASKWTTTSGVWCKEMSAGIRTALLLLVYVSGKQYRRHKLMSSTVARDRPPWHYGIILLTSVCHVRVFLVGPSSLLKYISMTRTIASTLVFVSIVRWRFPDVILQLDTGSASFPQLKDNTILKFQYSARRGAFEKRLLVSYPDCRNILYHQIYVLNELQHNSSAVSLNTFILKWWWTEVLNGIIAPCRAGLWFSIWM